MIQSIEICSYGPIQESIKIPIGQLTLIHGNNGSGKSSICRAIAAALTSTGSLPYQVLRNSASEVNVAIDFKHKILGDLKFERNIAFTKSACGNEATFNRNELRIDNVNRPDINAMSSLINFSFLSASDISDAHTVEEFFEASARFLGYTDSDSEVAKKAVLDIIGLINQRNSRAFEKIEVDNGKIYLQHWGKDFLFPYTGAGTGDKLQLHSDFLLEASFLLGQHCHVFLILDAFPTYLVAEQFQRRYRQLSSPNIQVLMTTIREESKELLGADVWVALEDSKAGNGIRVKSTQTISRPNAVTIEQSIESYQAGSEDRFIDEFVVPALRALKFEGIRRTPSHGAGEHGFDIQLFHRNVFPGRIAYFGAQVKTGNVSAKSSGSGSVNELIDQLKKILTVSQIDPVTQLRTRADYALAIISGKLTSDAQRVFDDAFEGDRRVVLWDTNRFASALYEAGVWPTIQGDIENKRC